MEYREALGQVLREIRVGAGLRREDCSAALSREYLSSVERGSQSISIEKLRALCDVLGISPSLVLFAVEARLATLEFGVYRGLFDRQLDEHVTSGKLSTSAAPDAQLGVRGKRAELNREAVQSLQSDGFTKAEIVRRLGLGRTTVDRYWRSHGNE